jgi:hypothetical protein
LIYFIISKFSDIIYWCPRKSVHEHRLHKNNTIYERGIENPLSMAKLEVSTTKSKTMAKNTIKSCSYPILGKLLSFVPRDVFKKSVMDYQSDKWYKKAKTWDQFVFRK